MLAMDIKDMTQQVSNSEELFQDQVAKRDRLLQKTKDLQIVIEQLKADMKLTENEVFKSKCDNKS
jgi:hypothetical protein